MQEKSNCNFEIFIKFLENKTLEKIKITFASNSISLLSGSINSGKSHLCLELAKESDRNLLALNSILRGSFKIFPQSISIEQNKQNIYFKYFDFCNFTYNKVEEQLITLEKNNLTVSSNIFYIFDHISGSFNITQLGTLNKIIINILKISCGILIIDNDLFWKTKINPDNQYLFSDNKIISNKITSTNNTHLINSITSSKINFIQLDEANSLKITAAEQSLIEPINFQTNCSIFHFLGLIENFANEFAKTKAALIEGFSHKDFLNLANLNNQNSFKSIKLKGLTFNEIYTHTKLVVLFELFKNYPQIGFKLKLLCQVFKNQNLCGNYLLRNTSPSAKYLLYIIREILNSPRYKSEIFINFHNLNLTETDQIMCLELLEEIQKTYALKITIILHRFTQMSIVSKNIFKI